MITHLNHTDILIQRKKQLFICAGPKKRHEWLPFDLTLFKDWKTPIPLPSAAVDPPALFPRTYYIDMLQLHIQKNPSTDRPRQRPEA